MKTSIHITLALAVVAMTALSSCSESSSPPENAEEPTTQQEVKTTSGSIRGNIVAIMADGHVEPARVPDVTLVRTYDDLWREGGTGQHITPAYEAFLKGLNVSQDLDQLIVHPLKYSKLDPLYSLAQSEARVADLGIPAGRKAALITVEADEEGNFEVVDAEAGQYEIVALGQAGSYRDVLWNGSVTVEEGKEAKVTLHRVLQACK
jgi:hypothetical protein